MTNGAGSVDLNPFDPVDESKLYDVAEMLLSGETVSWNDILAEVGSFSPRSMGRVLRALERQHLSILRLRDPYHGTLYRFDPEVEFDEKYRLSDDGSRDGQRELNPELFMAAPKDPHPVYLRKDFERFDDPEPVGWDHLP